VTLRITREDGSAARERLSLEGCVVAEWAALLERECFAVLRSQGSVSLDLVGVNFVDRAGIDALRRLSHVGVEIRCRPGPVASVLEAEGVRVAPDADDRDHGRPSRAARGSNRQRGRG
jgi:hypothetical protein